MGCFISPFIIFNLPAKDKSEKTKSLLIPIQEILFTLNNLYLIFITISKIPDNIKNNFLTIQFLQVVAARYR
jgi:hypothetical protein